MILWMIQTEDVYSIIQKTGIYHCDFSKTWIPEFKDQYEWMAGEMKKRIGDKTLRKKAGSKMTEGMIMPYKKVIDRPVEK